MGIINLDKSDGIGQLVEAGETITSTQTIPDGETWIIEEYCGAAAYNTDVLVKVEFDGGLLFCTHGEFHKNGGEEYTGDGSKQIIISLINDSINDETMGCCYRARKKL